MNNGMMDGEENLIEERERTRIIFLENWSCLSRDPVGVAPYTDCHETDCDLL